MGMEKQRMFKKNTDVFMITNCKDRVYYFAFFGCCCSDHRI